MSGLAVRGLQRSHGGRAVLRGIDLDVAEGQTLALLGPSGCGKTTLLRLIAGFDRCAAGTIALGGTLLDDGALHVPTERRGIGYVPQEGLLFPHLTVAGNVGFGLTRAARLSGRIEAALELVGLSGPVDFRARQPHQLSGGQQQRVALARALAPAPRLVLLDEPFTGLDHTLRRDVAADVAAVLRQSRTTAVLVTHDPQEAFAGADRIAVMRDGLIVQSDEPVALYRRPADIAVARLLGPTVEIEGDVAGLHAATPLGRLMVSPGGALGRARIVLRPEQVGRVPRGTGVPTRVIAARFRGDHTLTTLDIAGARVDLRLGGALGPGDNIDIAVTGAALAFPP